MPHIYQTCPSANVYDCKAMAIGARSQSARTYLEKFLDVFPDCKYETSMFKVHSFIFLTCFQKEMFLKIVDVAVVIGKSDDECIKSTQQQKNKIFCQKVFYLPRMR